ncbi:hypothetical protein V8F20_006080, partial [Naviculisporaceae sp. PSN 640]
MDPVSIVGSILGISTAIRNVSAGVALVTSLQNAPLEILDLQNELETIQGYLDVLQRALRPMQKGKCPDMVTELTLNNIATCLRVLQVDVNNLQQVTVSLGIDPRSDGVMETIRKVKWKRHKETIMAHRKRIRRRRVDVAQAVGLLQPVQSERHLSLLLDVQRVNEATSESVKELIHASTQGLLSSINSRFPQEPGDMATLAPKATSTNILVTAEARQSCTHG